jgi:hypothetical protein
MRNKIKKKDNKENKNVKEYFHYLSRHDKIKINYNITLDFI